MQTNQHLVRTVGWIGALLGDNRHNAADSRYADSLGGSPFINLDNLVGRIELIYLSADAGRTGRLIDAK